MIDLEGLVVARHPSPEWATFLELRRGTGYQLDGRADVATFNCWPSKNNLRIAYEIKRTRQDFSKEIDHPLKREWLEKYFHQTYFVITQGVCSEDEIPEGWGLLVATKKGDKLRRIKIAKTRDPKVPPESLWLSALRRAAEELERETKRFYRLDGVEVTREDIHKKVDELVEKNLKVKRECLNSERKQVLSERDELSVEKRRLREPLATLAERVGVGKYSLFYSGPTVEQVEAWLNDAATGKHPKLTRKMEKAHELIGEALSLIGERIGNGS